jgi:CRP/FNR family transcriptional regulator
VAVSFAIDPKALTRLRTLSWMRNEQAARLAANATALKVRRDAAIFMEGEASSQVYILLSGVAKLCYVNRDQRVLVGFVGPGEVFGLSSLLPQTTRPFRCEAYSDCSVAVVKPEVFVDTVLGVPLERLSLILDATVGRWWGMVVRYANFVGLGLRARLAGALLELAEKFGVRDSRGTLLTIKLTHADLAELVGASRQRTTEQLNDFEREQVIIRDGRRLIIVPEKLWQLAQTPQTTRTPE